MYLQGDCSELYSYSKGKKSTSVCNQNQEGGGNIMSFRSEMEFKKCLDPISNWLHTPIIS